MDHRRKYKGNYSELKFSKTKICWILWEPLKYLHLFLRMLTLGKNTTLFSNKDITFYKTAWLSISTSRCSWVCPLFWWYITDEFRIVELYNITCWMKENWFQFSLQSNIRNKGLPIYMAACQKPDMVVILFCCPIARELWWLLSCLNFVVHNRIFTGQAALWKLETELHIVI